MCKQLGEVAGMPKPIMGKGRYMAGLDGLRALAVLAVVAYHLQFEWIPGGLLGVGVFFVLSGYLITDLLVMEWKRNGRIDLADFWLRRARRLLPAMFVLLAAVIAWLLIREPSRLIAIREELLASLLYVSNWWLIFHEVSYFESFGPPSPLGHFWSLAVEEQFYLLWPLLLMAGIRLFRKRGMLFAATTGAALLSACLMVLLYEPGADPSRVYYGTDTRAFGLLIGAALAMVWPSAKLPDRVSPLGRWSLDLVGAVGMVILLGMFWKTNEYDPFLYQGGFAILSLVTAIVVAVLAHPATRLGKFMGAAPFRWIGLRSYGIYLWHYPVIVLTSPAVNTSGVNLSLSLMQLAASVILADLSWRFVEEPIRRGTWKRLWERVRPGQGRRSRAAWLTTAAAVVIGLVFAGMSQLYPIATASTYTDDDGPDHPSGNHPATEQASRQEQHQAARETSSSEAESSPGHVDAAAGKAGKEAALPIRGGQSPAASDSVPRQGEGLKNEGDAKGTAGDAGTTETAGTAGAADTAGTAGKKGIAGDPSAAGASGASRAGGMPPGANGATDPAGPAGTPGASHQTTGSTSATAGTAVRGSGKGITVIGDSVMLGAEPSLKEMLPGITIDGKIGRQWSHALEIIKRLKAEGKLGQTVVLELGSNGPFTAKQMDAILEALGEKRQIILVNTRVPRPWEREVNAGLKQRADSSKAISLIDWYGASTGKDHYFAKDGVHLTVEGAKAYADLLTSGILSRMQDH